MTAYTVGDKTGEIVLGLPEDLDPAEFTSAELFVDDLAYQGTLDTLADPATFTVPSVGPFEVAGLTACELVLSRGDDSTLTLYPESFVVQGRKTGWHTLASARREWATKGSYSDAQLYTLLECARVSVETYGPALDPESKLPLGWKQAQLMQARNIANSAKTDPGIGNDGELFVIRPYPLDNFIRELIRPRSAVPRVG